jgi:hypothetical protein
MVAKLTRLTHKIPIQMRLVAESCTICSSRCRRPVRKLLDTLPYVDIWRNTKEHILWLCSMTFVLWLVLQLTDLCVQYMNMRFYSKIAVLVLPLHTPFHFYCTKGILSLNWPAAWSRVLESPIQLESSLPYSQEPATGPYPEPHEWSSHFPFLFLYDSY